MKQKRLFIVIVILFFQRAMCIFGWNSKHVGPERGPIEYYGEFNPTKIRENYEDQPVPKSKCSLKVNKEKIDGILALDKMIDSSKPKVEAIWEFTCLNHKTCEKGYDGIFCKFKDGNCHADVDYYNTTFQYFDWNQEEEYAYCRNAVPHCFIDLREYSCDGVVLHHFDENTTAIEHERCQWNFITDPKKRVVLEYYRETEGDVSISALADNEDPKSRVQMYFPKNFTSGDKDKHIISLTKTNITQFTLGVRKLEDKVNYTIVIRMEDIDAHIVNIFREVVAILILLLAVAFLIIMCNKYRIKAQEYDPVDVVDQDDSQRQEVNVNMSDEVNEDQPIEEAIN